MPRPAARPRTNVVLPAPRFPERSTTLPGTSCEAKWCATACVSSSECVRWVPVTSIRVRLFANQSSERLREMRQQIGGRHCHLTYAELGEVTRGAVQEHGKATGRFGVEELCQPGPDHARKDVSGPPSRHTGISGWIDEDVSVRCGNDRSMTLQHHVQPACCGVARRHFD